MSEGKLFYDENSERYWIVYNDKDKEPCDLHCGDCFEVGFIDRWIPTRIEYDHMSKNSHGWYLTGEANMLRLDGLAIRMA